MSVDPFAILEKRIRTGEYRPGLWLAPERQLAEELGVNRGTIRRALARLSSAGLITAEPGRRPIVRYPQAGAGQPGTVALLMGNEPRYHAFQVVVRGCEAVLRQEGYRLVFMDTWASSPQAGIDREMEALQSLIEHPVSGVILWCQHPSHVLGHLQRLQENAVPVVAIDRELPSLETDFVVIDNVNSAITAVEHLISLGHRRIGFATHQDQTKPVLDREEGYRRALARAGIPVDESLIFRFPFGNAEADCADQANEMLSMSDRPTAVFAVNDILALRLLNAFCDAGVDVPREMALVGFDDLEALSMTQTGLTTIHQPYEAMGQHAARLVCRRLEAPAAPLQHVILDTSLVQRASTRQDVAPSHASDRSVRSWLPATQNAV